MCFRTEQWGVKFDIFLMGQMNRTKIAKTRLLYRLVGTKVIYTEAVHRLHQSIIYLGLTVSNEEILWYLNPTKRELFLCNQNFFKDIFLSYSVIRKGSLQILHL